MKHTLLIALSLLAASCAHRGEPLPVTVSNPLEADRTNEIVELSIKDVRKRMKVSDTASLIVTDGLRQLPQQLTHDGKLIFPVSIKAKESNTYLIIPGTPDSIPTKACGRMYPERLEDIAWENDLVGFRAYGPALQARGERGYGYDLFTKRGTDRPVVEQMYALETDKAAWKRINAVRKSDPELAARMIDTISYHKDHGFGMDCYAVGPTLGAGVAALMYEGEIVYPWCYQSYEILDNGPLRFTVKLVFGPTQVGDDSEVIETRIITLDAGSHFNKTSVNYANLSKPCPIVTGIVLHDRSGATVTNATEGYMAYEDPTTGPGQGIIYLGHAFAQEINRAEVCHFSPEEKQRRNNAEGHVLAFAEYTPESTFTYHWGFAWNQADIHSMEEWNEHLSHYAQTLRQPLKVTY